MQHGKSHQSWWSGSSAAISQAMVLLTAMALASCGGGSSSMGYMGSTGTNPPPTTACANCGTAMVSLTDAPGDFLSYMVNVVSLQLTRADGTMVETVPVATQVDFAQLVNLSEIISAKQVPAGDYVSAAITLDFSGATIVVDNGSGGVTIAANQLINGTTSMPLAAPNPTQLTLKLSLSGSGNLVVTAGTVANLALDFNLATSNAVTPSGTSPTTVTVNPTLMASLVPDATKTLRVRGPLVSVSTSASDYLINVRPFHDADDTAGQVTIGTTSSTSWTINGVSYTGSAGLTQLATLPAGTLTAAIGAWTPASMSFTATSVAVGSSVTGTMNDGVEGAVVARTGNTVMLANSIVFPHDVSGMSFARQITVSLGTGTTVTEQGMSGALSIADISVGQHLQVAGTMSKDSGGNITLDATAGSAQLLPTVAQGVVTSTAAGMVTLNLETLDGRAPTAFNFAGTGTSSTQDATAAAYAVSVQALPSSAINAGMPARFIGFVTPFGMAPPDFVAQTVINYSQTRAVLQVRWPVPGVTAPFATISDTELLVNQPTLKMGAQPLVRVGPSVLDPSTLTAGLEIVPDMADTSPAFAIAHWQSRSIDTFNTFTAFVTAVMSDLNGTVAALDITAAGPYNAATGVLSADQVILVLNN